MMDFTVASELQKHLAYGERLLWSGQPRKGLIFRKTDILLIPFSLLWFGFIVFWIIIAAQSSVLFSLFGIPFLMIGFVFAVGRFFIDKQQRDKTLYGLTGERIIIKSGNLFRPAVTSLHLKALSDVEYTEEENGSGTIQFGPRIPGMRWNTGMSWWPGMKEPTAFEMIPDVRFVYNKIIDLQRELK